MKILTLMLLLTALSMAETDDDDAPPPPPQHFFHFDVPVLGNIVAPIVPARLFSLGVDIGDVGAFYLEPIAGYGAIKGAGAFVGLYARTGENALTGIKYSRINVQDNGWQNEFYVDFQYYHRINRTFSLRYGGAVGYGISVIGQDNLAGPDHARVEEGATLRTNLDISWRAAE